VAEESDAVVGTAMCWKFGADQASLGQVIVSPEHQGRGIGRRLMQMILEELGPRITFLHATPAGRPLYEKLGFSECGLLEQYQGNVGKAAPIALLDGERLRVGTSADFPYFLELDSSVSGLERPSLLSALLLSGKSIVLERNGQVIGFSVMRRFGRGHVIGPVIAERSRDDVRARALIGHWLVEREGEFVRIDVPSGTSLTDWLERQGLERVDVCSKMVRNAPAVACGGECASMYGLYGLISQAML
jgi:N-acetylglutamate synthase-like GNAT family acetyltransferase